MKEGWTESREHLGVTGARLRIRSQDADAHLISFVGLEGEVGYLGWKEGQLTFGGDMDESARIFLTCLGPLVEAAVQQAREDEEAAKN